VRRVPQIQNRKCRSTRLADLRHVVSRISTLILTIVLLTSIVCAQEDQQPSLSSIAWGDLCEIVGGVGGVYASPLSWDGNDVARFGLTTGFVAASFLLDDEMRSLTLQGSSPLADRIDQVGYFYGRVSTAAVFTAGIYGVGLVARDDWLRGTGVVLIQTLVSAGSFNLILKPLFGRSRPYLNRTNHDFRFWSWQEDRFSLPSGHAVVAFGVSSVLAARIKNPWATAGLYTLAGVTAWSRLYSDAHWFSDVVVGAALSSAVGIFLTNRYEKADSALGGLRVLPMPDRLALSYSF